MMLQGKTVIVAGVGSGLGKECATAALSEGVNVVMAARTQQTLEATAAEVDPSGAHAAAVPADITDADSCAALVARAQERFGSVDELGADNIRCNMVVPSWMWGPSVQMFVEGTAKQKGISAEEALNDSRR